jgi:hypothetical protein
VADRASSFCHQPLPHHQNLDHLPALIYLTMMHSHQDLCIINESFKGQYKNKGLHARFKYVNFKGKNSNLTSPMFHSANPAKNLLQPSVQVHSSYKAFSKNNQPNNKKMSN